MSLPLPKTYRPMEAMPEADLPRGANWHYEPKWDGFRCLAFRDGTRIDLESKSQKPLTRYFPELVEALSRLGAQKFVLDGEIVIPANGSLSFDHLLMRIHPAASRIAKLSKETPCVFIVFDLLVDERGHSLVEEPLNERRRRLERFAAEYFADDANHSIRLSPLSYDISTARKWFHMGVALDGIVAKRDDLPYQTGERTGMQKIKKKRTADCVVGGFRYLEKKTLVGSLLLGLYNKQGLLDHVGFTSSIHSEDRAALTKRLEALIKPPGFTGKAPGGLSRWSTKRSMEWQPLAPKLVAEVEFDHFTGGRFRHGTRFLRWRPEKAPRDCTIEQVKRENRSALGLLSAQNDEIRRKGSRGSSPDEAGPTRAGGRKAGPSKPGKMEGGKLMAACSHLNQIRNVKAHTNGCEECLKLGDSWVHLRLCLICGHVGCCDSSKNRHATKHFHSTHHPVMKSFEPGEDWAWCYVDQVELDLP